ncbi:MAG: hypothetical protein V1875_08580 [Candidatus Altiarchaeota archaeon]
MDIGLIALAAIAAVASLIALKAFRASGRGRLIKSVASELGLAYSSQFMGASRANGHIRGFEVIIDTVGVSLRVRVIHNGNVGEGFTVGKADYLAGAARKPGFMKFECVNPEFMGRFRVKGGDPETVKRYLDADMQGKITSCGIGFTIGRHDISYVDNGSVKDKKTLVNVVNLVIEAADKAQKI